MAFPTCGILDDFNREDEGPPPSGNWTDLWNGMAVDTNECAGIVASPDYNSSGWNQSTFGPHSEGYCTISNIGDDGNEVYVIIRYDYMNFNGYAVRWVRDDIGSDEISIERVDDSIPTQLATMAHDVNDGDKIGIECDGNTINAYYKSPLGAWGLITTAVDATYPDAGYNVLVIIGENVRVDDFGGGDYVAPPTPPPPPTPAVEGVPVCIECARLGNPFAPPAELDWYISPDGEAYQFDNASDNILLAFQGYGMPGIEYIEQQGPFQHGKTLLDYRLQPRIIQLEHRREACDRYSYWTKRDELLNVLRPNRQLPNKFELGTLRKILPGNVKRDIDVLVQQGPVFAARLDGGDFLDFTEVIQFIAPDPTFYDPDAQSVTWAITEVGGLKFLSAAAPDELESPWVFGTDYIGGAAQVHYQGTWLAYPTIYFIGPLNYPLITNDTTGEKIQLAYNIPAGETVTISLAFGNKTVTSNTGANLIGYVTSDSDLSTFHIAPEPEANWCGTLPRPCGLNTISASGGGGIVGQTQIRMTYNVRYLGY